MTDLIDANVLIEAYRRYYSMDICPGFWDWLGGALALGDVVLIPQVAREVTPRSQILINWLRNDATIQEPRNLAPIDHSRRQVTARVNQLGCTPYSVNKFMLGGDFHLAAFADAGGHRIVTLETKEDPNKSSRRLKLPDLCDSMGIEWARPFQMLKDHGVRFEWSG